MTDVVSDVKDAVEVEEVVKKVETEKNGDAVVEKTENETDATEKSEQNGDAKENGISDKETEFKDSTDGVEVCGIKRKSEVGLESDEATVESSEKKQKTEDSEELKEPEEPEEPEVATNGVC